MMNRREALGRMGAAALLGMGATGRTGAADGKPAPLHTRRIPSSGELIPAIGVGTYVTFDVSDAPARAELEKVLITFADMGGRVIDSSPMYGRAEDNVWELSARHGLRPRQFIATKVWTTGKAAGIRQMEDSMRKLRAGQSIDLMQVHNLVDAETHLPTLMDWKRSGRVRYVGVTHWDVGAYGDVAKAMSAHKLDFIQINYSVGERQAEQRLLPLARERGIAVIANRPFAGGDMFGRLQSRPLPAWAAEIGCTSWAQLMLKFVISHPAITCAIPGTGRLTHLLDNLGAARGSMPDAAFRAKIAAATA